MAIDPITVAKLWMTIKPIKRLKERRRAKRMAEKLIVTTPEGAVLGEHIPPTIPARTSTKLAVGNGAIAAFPAVELLQWVQSIEFSPVWLEAATNSDYFIYYGSLLISYLIARFTKSPVLPGKL